MFLFKDRIDGDLFKKETEPKSTTVAFENQPLNNIDHYEEHNNTEIFTSIVMKIKFKSKDVSVKNRIIYHMQQFNTVYKIGKTKFSANIFKKL